MPDVLAIDIVVQSPLWDAQPGIAEALCGALDEAAAMLSTNPAELAIVLTDDSAVRVLNRDWRGIDKATNVLSFPMQTPGQPVAGRSKSPPVMLGDIVIAYETAAREADAESKSLRDHLVHLAVHGFLHLLGYDHDSDRDAETMEGIERAILARLDISDPYAARDLAATAGPHA
jgi:probable rRNA maturation factor